MERWEWLSSASKKYRGNIGESARTLGSRHSAPPGRCPAHVSWPSCLKTPCPGLEQGDTHHHRHPLESIRFQLLSSCLQRFPCRFRHHPTCREDQGDEASIGERPGLDSSPLYLLEVCGLLDDVEREVLGCRFGSLTAKEGVNLDIEVHSPLERPSEPDIVPPSCLRTSVAHALRLDRWFSWWNGGFEQQSHAWPPSALVWQGKPRHGPRSSILSTMGTS